MTKLLSAALAVLVCLAVPAGAQCLSDPVSPSALQFDADYLFGGLDKSLGGQFPAWLARWQQENASDPTAGFIGEDNCQNGIDDDDHLDLLAAILEGEPVASVLSGVNASDVTAIRASFAANRAKVRPDLTLTIIFVTVNIIDEINKDDPDFGESLQDLVAAYMTIGDAESVAYIRGLLITLGEIFIEVGVDNGDIPAIVEGLTKSTLRSTVNANFVAPRYECFGDVPGAAKRNLLGDTGNIGGNGQTNEQAYAAAGRDRQAWLVAKGVAKPPLQIATLPVDLSVSAGTPAALTAALAGGAGTPISYDWKRVNEATGATTAASQAFPLSFSYPLAQDAGLYQLFVCDGTWLRATLPVRLTVIPAAFQITTQPQPATRAAGESVTFTAGVTGGEVLPSYQWYRGAMAQSLVMIPGEDGPVLSIDGLEASDAGFYQARITGGPLTAPIELSSQTALLTVQEFVDDVAPVLTLNGASEVQVACGAVYEEANATALDEVDGDLSEAIEISGSVDTGAPGSYVLTYSVEDAAGNAASVQRTITVSDTAAPLLALIGADSVTIACKGVFAEPGATAADACDGNLDASINISGTVNTSAPGSYTRTYTVADSSGNTSTLTRTVNVVDSVAPQITRVGNAVITLTCGGALNDPGAVASDACAGNLAGNIVATGVIDINTPGAYTRTYTVTDPSGNSASTTRQFNVSDVTPPVLALNGADPLVIACGAVFSDPGATANDACEGDLDGAIQATGAVNTTSPATYQRIYTVSDSGGNSAQITRSVVVTDEIAPEVTLNGAAAVNVACGSVFNDPGAAAQDACGGVQGLPVSVTGAVDTSTPGAYTLTYAATDASGNTGSKTRTITVFDSVAPVVTLRGAAAVTVACDGAFSDAGADAVDGCDGVIAPVQVTGSVDVGMPGLYTLTYTAMDAAGNTGTATRSVTVEAGEDTLSIAGPNPVLVACGDVFEAPAYTVTRACVGDVTESANVSISGVVDTASPGSYALDYALDGGAATTLTVQVSDTRAPEISLNGSETVEVSCGANFSDPGARAVDACDGDLSGSIVATGAVDTAEPGDYTRTYSVADSAGNTAVRTRTVRVVGGATPAIQLSGLASVAVSCGGGYAEPGFTATDVCGGDATARVSVSGSVNTASPGAYTLTYSLGAADGGPAQATRTVTVLPDCVITFRSQPASQDLYIGQIANFIVIAEGGSEALQYQWFFNGEEIPGEAGATLVVAGVTPEDAGEYACLVTDGFTEVFSDTATLAVFALPASGQQSADTNGDWSISLSELLRLIQFYNTLSFSCAEGTEDGYVPGPGDTTCAPHATDYAPQDWVISLSELLRAIQFYNTPGGAYRVAEGTEDGYAPGAG